MKASRVLALVFSLVLVAGCTTNRHPTYSSVPGYGNQVISSPPYGASPPAPRNYPPGTTPPTVYSQASPGGTTDDAIVNRAQQALNAQGLGTAGQNLQVSAQNGNVTLTGSVPNEQQRQLAETTVRNVSGVVSVNDQLQVAAPGTAASPAVPENESTPSTQAPPPTGRSDQGSRTYSQNPAPSPAPASPATTTAAESIFNLQVQDLTETDRALAQKILENLRTDSTLNSLLPRVNIRVAEGKVILDGVVQSETQKKTIASEVERAAGVKNVMDHLQVQGAPANTGQNP